MNELRYGVIGYGFIGRRHVNTLKEMEGFDCTAVCDINPVRLKEVKELYPEMAVYEDADELFAKEKLDGVIIAANNNQHKSLAIKAARAGKHILVSVYADVRNVINREVDDYFKIILRFENMVTAEIELGTYFLSDKKDWFERHWFVGGNKGSMYADKFAPEGKIVRTAHLLENVKEDQDKSAASYGPTRSFGVPAPGLILLEDIPKTTYKQSDFFVNYGKAVRGEEEFLVKVSEVRRVLAVMEACRESARTMASVAFE